MSESNVPLLAADGFMSPVTPNQSFVYPTPSVASRTPSQSIAPSTTVNEIASVTTSATRAAHEPPIVAKNETVIQYQALEGYLAICGGCNSKILFPLGRTRVDCTNCGSINYLSPQAIPKVPNKALLSCPKCSSSILYTIGCTHFQCTCGCVIEIPIPDYYLPFVNKHKYIVY